MDHIIVIGAGVIGLSAALRLQEAGYSVTIVAKDFPVPFETADPHALIDYASPWAGAHNRWVLPVDDLTTRDHELAKETYIHMKQIVASNPECGIAFARGIEYLESPSAEYLALDETKARIVGMENWKRIPNAELPPKVTWGCEYDTWCANPMVYCLFLLRQFVQGGGKTVHAALKNSLDAVSRGPAAAVVNCSGTGFNDPACFPTRGQTCVVANTCAATVTRQNADGTWTFCVPRGFSGGSVIGGTKEPNNYDEEPSTTIREHLLANLAATYPSILANGPLTVLRDIVGRRPTRHGGIRLERENNDTVPLIHAYGLGGRGYELSWGVAGRVIEMLK